jgi:hypothetical protein
MCWSGLSLDAFQCENPKRSSGFSKWRKSWPLTTIVENHANEVSANRHRRGEIWESRLARHVIRGGDGDHEALAVIGCMPTREEGERRGI